MNQIQSDSKFEERVISIRRVSKKTTGGNYVTFSALVAVGNRKGGVGIGLGRGLEVPQAIKKGLTHAKKHLIQVPVHKNTIPHEVYFKYKAGQIFIKPAPEGTGLKVGSVVRTLFDLAGIYNASGKIYGSKNKTVNTYLIIEALKKLKKKELPFSKKKE